MKRIRVPDEMLQAAIQAYCNTNSLRGTKDCSDRDRVECGLESALLWLSEHPQIPTEADVMTILQERVESGHITGKEYCAIPPATVRFVIREWQRRCFVQEEPEIPAEIEELCRNSFDGLAQMTIGDALEAWPQRIKAVAEEAFRRGLRKGEQK